MRTQLVTTRRIGSAERVDGAEEEGEHRSEIRCSSTAEALRAGHRTEQRSGTVSSPPQAATTLAEARSSRSSTVKHTTHACVCVNGTDRVRLVLAACSPAVGWRCTARVGDRAAASLDCPTVRLPPPLRRTDGQR